MNREEAKKFLLEELKKVPDRDVCRVATEEQIQRIAAELDFETMIDFLEVEDLELSIAEIPEKLHTEIVLYFCMLTEYEYYVGISDEAVWNAKLDDESTYNFITNIKRIFWLSESERVTEICIADFLEYSRSDKPDF